MKKLDFGIIISPAKRLNTNSTSVIDKTSVPEYMTDAETIMKVVKEWDPVKTRAKFGLSENFSKLAYERNQNWRFTRPSSLAHHALFMYNGDVYRGMRTDTFTENELHSIQRKSRILSAVYGILKPMDGVYPYRLQMSTPTFNAVKSDLYEFWNEKITDLLNDWITRNKYSYIINLASEEYFQAINISALKSRIIKPVFRQFHQGKLGSYSLFLKKARGMMVRFIVSNNITNPEHLKYFDVDGYLYTEQLSTKDKWVFVKEGL
jgi:cytoplasmic iron level regulating protein YaaA (DUF328/UPF0246 family)